MKRYGLLFGLAFLAGLFLFASQITVDDAEGFNPMLIDSRIGSEAPDFTLKDMNGNAVTLSSLKGKPVLLNFWATWCPYCRKERKHLNDLHSMYSDKGLIILSVSTDKSLDRVKNYMKKDPADFIVLFDSDGTVAASYNIGGLPTSYFIDREGVLRKKSMGYREWTSAGSLQYIDKFLSN